MIVIGFLTILLLLHLLVHLYHIFELRKVFSLTFVSVAKMILQASSFCDCVDEFETLGILIVQRVCRILN